jgi:hypothetical protein
LEQPLVEALRARNIPGSSLAFGEVLDAEERHPRKLFKE